jgi:peptide/nickel transport system substrate-binding protein
MKLSTWVNVVAFASVVALVGCAPTAPARPGQSGESAPATAPVVKRMTAAIMGEPRTVRNSINAAGGSGTIPGIDAVENMLNVSLAVLDAGGQLQPRLGEAIPSIENGQWHVFPDGRMLTTWKLRPGARWHDGTPVTSEDFVFTSTVGRDPELPVFRDQMYQFIDDITAPDAHTLAIGWKSPYIDAVEMFQSTQTQLLPKHLLAIPFAEDKPNFTQLPYWNEEFVGTGPYRIREWARGSHMVLSANEDYVLGRPKVNEVVVRFIPDPNTLMANVLAGSVDVTLGRSLSVDQAVRVRDQWTDGTMAVSPVNWVAMYPQFVNPTPAVIADVQFRRAIYHAVDRQEMADTLQAGMAQVAHSVLIPGTPEFRDVEKSIVRYDYDPRRSVQLIESLGFTRGADGIFRETGDERLTIDLRTVKHDLYEKALFGVADYLRRVGLATNEVIVPPTRITDREYRATYPSFEVIENPNDFPRIYRLRASEVPLPENRFTGSNRARYMNAEFDAMLERYFTTIPMRSRAEVAAQIVHHMMDQLVWMGLFHQAEPTMIANRLQNVLPRYPSSTQAWNAHEWDVRN